MKVSHKHLSSSLIDGIIDFICNNISKEENDILLHITTCKLFQEKVPEHNLFSELPDEVYVDTLNGEVFFYPQGGSLPYCVQVQYKPLLLLEEDMK